MNKLKISTASDGVFIYFLFFFISYGIIKARILSIATSTLLSAIFSAFFTFILILFISKKEKNKEQNLYRTRLQKAFNNYLYLLSDKEVILLISSYLNKIGVNYKVKNSTFYFCDKNLALDFNFSPEKTSLSTCLNFYKQTPKKYNIIILSCEYESNTAEFFKQFERVKLYLSNDLLNALEKENLLPILQIEKRQKITFKRLISSFLQPKNVKKFFLWGAMLTLFSTLSYYKYFYVFLGSSFLILSAYLKFFKSKTFR